MEVTEDVVAEVAKFLSGEDRSEVDELEAVLDRKPTLPEIAKLKELLPEYVFRCESCDIWYELDLMVDHLYENAGICCCYECENG